MNNYVHALRFIDRVDDILAHRGCTGASAMLGLACARLQSVGSAYGAHVEKLRQMTGPQTTAEDLEGFLRRDPSAPKTPRERKLMDEIAAAFRAAVPTSMRSYRTWEGRLFPPMVFPNGWALSIQGDAAGYACRPRARLDVLQEYEEVEVVVFTNDQGFVAPDSLGLSEGLLAKFSPACEAGPYIGANLNWADIGELFETVRAMPALDPDPDPEFEP